MERQEVTYDEVAAAAESLQSDGKQVTIESVSTVLDAGVPTTIHKHLAAWRASRVRPAEVPKAQIPEPLIAALGDWARQFADDAGAGVRAALAQSESDLAALYKSAGQLEAELDDLQAQLASVTAVRDQALETVAEQGENIERLTAELRNARRIATDALVGKAKDQLAIEGKDSQLADLRAQVERYVAASATQSDARLAAEMELVGAVTARDNFAAEIKEMRAQLDASRAERRGLQVEA